MYLYYRQAANLQEYFEIIWQNILIHFYYIYFVFEAILVKFLYNIFCNFSIIKFPILININSNTFIVFNRLGNIFSICKIIIYYHVISPCINRSFFYYGPSYISESVYKFIKNFQKIIYILYFYVLYIFIFQNFHPVPRLLKLYKLSIFKWNQWFM